MRRLALVALVLLSGCAAEEAEAPGGADQGRPVIETYRRPLEQGAALPDPGEASEAGSEAQSPGETKEAALESWTPGERPAPSSDEAGLWLLAESFEENLQASGRVLDEPELQAYVRELACKVVGPHCPDLRIYVVSRSGFNATMAPNGVMEIWTGALLRLRSEAELAALIGHEFGHYLRRHSIQRLRSTRTKLSEFLRGHAGTATARAGYFDLVGSLSGYSRENEREADGYGLRMLAEAGYDPQAFPTLWRRVAAEYAELEAKAAGAGFYSTHPLLQERADVLAELADEVRAGQSGPPILGRQAYLSKLQPRRADFLHAELHERAFDQVEVLLDELLKDDDPNPAELHFFKGEIHRLRADRDDLGLALNSYDTALRAKGSVPSVLHRSRGLVLRRMTENSSAVLALQAYLEAEPGAVDRTLVEDLIVDLRAE